MAPNFRNMSVRRVLPVQEKKSKKPINQNKKKNGCHGLT